MKILFVRLENICRSPMADFAMKDMVKKAGREDEFYIASAATSAEEIGNPVYPPVEKLLASHGIDCSGKTARRLTKEDYAKFDLIIGMDQSNMRNMRLFFEDTEGKVRCLMDYTDTPKDVADPWYTRDFAATWRDVNEGCRALLKIL